MPVVAIWCLCACPEVKRLATKKATRSYATQELQARGGRLPRSTWIQLDNTARENKNKVVLGFCQWLVAMGVTDEIRLSFLPVG